jgi:hypothetical protein
MNQPYFAILNDAHEVVPFELERSSQWSDWMELALKNERRVIERTIIGKALVSTVFLGINHSFGESKPLWFETMVFKANAGQRFKEFDCERFPQTRYTTWDEAKAGHAAMVDRVQEALG